MSGRFEVLRDPVLGEEVWLACTSNGLRVRVVPTERFREVAAVVNFEYGSTDLGFLSEGQGHRSPEGVAHYLEHKLFEDEELQAFDRFARRGARVNAMTSFAHTTYFFTATDRLEENLVDLLHLVSHAHITEENVEKERGIISQEIRMYEDNPEYRGFFDFLGCLYRDHPVRHPVGGTVESIAAITAEELLTCHQAFYCTGNAALAVAGPVDPEAVLDLAEGCGLRTGAAPQRLELGDLGPVVADTFQREFHVARPRVLIGFKDTSLPAQTEARLRRSLVTRILLDSLFGASSDLREELRREDLVDDSLHANYVCESSFGFTGIGCECADPEEVIQALRAVLFDGERSDLSEDHLERVRRKVLGSYVRSFASVKGMAFNHAKEALEDVPPFGNLERVQSVSLEEVRARRKEHFAADAFAAAVVRSGGA